jgi:hypothetical protein
MQHKYSPLNNIFFDKKIRTGIFFPYPYMDESFRGGTYSAALSAEKPIIQDI